MNLLAIEIDLDSFFDVNLIVFTTISFVFSVIVIAFFVCALKLISARAASAQGRLPEKLNMVYMRLLIFVFAQFIAFVTDVFLVVFGHNYRLPFFTSGVFLILIFYKLVFVLFKDFKELGYNAGGLLSTVKIASQVMKDKNLDSLNDAIQTIGNSKDFEVVPIVPIVETEVIKKPKIKYKNNTMNTKLPMVLILMLLITASSFCLPGKGANIPTQQIYETTNKIKGIPVESVELENYENSDNILIIKFKGKSVMYMLK